MEKNIIAEGIDCFEDLTIALQDFKKRTCIGEQGSLMDLKIPINIVSDWNIDQFELYFKLKK